MIGLLANKRTGLLDFEMKERSEDVKHLADRAFRIAKEMEQLAKIIQLDEAKNGA